MFQIDTENYEQVKGALKELLDKIEKVDKIDINQKEYKIKYTLGGDMKMILNLFGLNGPNAHYACPWCKSNLTDRVDCEQECLISRTLDEANKAHTEHSL